MDAGSDFTCFRQAHKRNHDQISRDHNPPPPPWQTNRPESSRTNALASSSSNDPLAISTFRYAGDGLDLRRPVMSQPRPQSQPVPTQQRRQQQQQQQQTVIDLTDEPDAPVEPEIPSQRHNNVSSSSRALRPPRFSRGDIIDLENRPDPQPEPQRPSQHNNAGSPELEVLYSRTVLPTSNTQTTGRHHGYVRLMEPQPQLAGPGRDFHRIAQRQGGWHGINMPVNLSRLEEFARRYPHGGLRPAAVAAAIRGEERIRREVAGIMQPVPLQQPQALHPPADDNDLFVFDGRGDIELPQGMDYENPGFPMATPPPPTYKAPSPAQQGFTRSPVEVDVLLCPNCEQELGVGDDELKRQVWVVRSCGHVYCGECMKNRPKAKGKNAKRPVKTKPFQTCLVAGCARSVRTPKSMFQVYL